MPSYTVFTDGATDLTAGASFAADADILLQDQTQAITTNLDVSTNAIDLFHVIGGAPRIASTAGGGCTLKIDNTYTTDPNVVWRAQGYCKWNFSTNAVPEMVIDGGTHVIASGTVTKLTVVSGTVTIESGVTITALVLNGGTLTTNAAIATVDQSGGTLISVGARIGATSYTLSGGSGYIENTSGSACTVLSLEAAGRFYPLAGDVATFYKRAGLIFYDAALRNLTLGSTAFRNYAGATPTSQGLVTVSNLTDDVKWAGRGSGVPVP